ncbi:hypothetical protein PENTCL1PPCAC_16882, partial [Pristionchus entomophagus]
PRLRERLAQRSMKAKAKSMIMEMDGKMSVYRSLEQQLQENHKAIVAVKYRIQMASRKRPSSDTQGGNVRKAPRIDGSN